MTPDIAICPDCRYDRSGLGDAPCPECGGTRPPLGHIPARTPPTLQLIIAMAIFLSPAPVILLLSRVMSF